MNKGYTLIELMVILVIVCCMAAIFGTAFSRCTGFGTDEVERRANEDARSFISSLRPDMTSVRTTCQSTDSDGDGYVTCTVSGETPHGREILSLDCRHSLFTTYQRGCRMTRIPLTGRLQ